MTTGEAGGTTRSQVSVPPRAKRQHAEWTKGLPQTLTGLAAYCYDPAMPRVLLVDDEPEVLEMLQVYCEEASYETLTASDGREALRLFYQHHPDIVITDIRMPTLDGFDLCKRIREISEVPIVVLGALG